MVKCRGDISYFLPKHFLPKHELQLQAESREGAIRWAIGV